MKPPHRFCRAALVAMSLFCSSFALSQQPFQSIRPEIVTEPEEGRTIKLLYRISQYSLGAGTLADGVTTGLALNHPTVASKRDGDFLARYSWREHGFPARYVSQTNPFAIGTTNALVSAGVAYSSDRLYRHGGRWRQIAAIAINAAQAAWVTKCAIDNTRQGARAERQIRASTGYTGVIVWSFH